MCDPFLGLKILVTESTLPLSYTHTHTHTHIIHLISERVLGLIVVTEEHIYGRYKPIAANLITTEMKLCTVRNYIP